MSSSASRTQSTSRAATTALRPRTKRFITGLEDLSPEASVNGNPTTSINSTPYDTPYESRLPSPIPSKYPSRTSSRNPVARTSLNAGLAGESSDLASSLSGFWGKSWTNLQGLASTVLGSDALEPIKDKIPTRSKRTVDANGAKQWGTSMSRQTSEPGIGSQEQRKALVIAKKREELLKRVDSDQYLSTNQYKRRTSDDFESISAPPAQAEERDALVYIYNVQPTDTLPGISIKFNCPLPTIKKANRLWSNDVMISRKTLLIPVEACNVKGRRVAGPEQKGMDFLSDLSETHDRRSSEATITPTTLGSNPITSDLSSSMTQPQTDEPWTHDSWILLSAHPTAIEIARMSRRDLGFFPRARRKSNANSSYSDLDTPSESFDLPRPPSIIISDTANTQPSTKHKSRRSSSSHAFAPKMIGPGGVGTLVGKGPSAPGPGEDKLSKAFQRALPKFANPGQPVFDETLEPEYTSSGALTPTSHAFENVGSTLEGWVRKMADRAAKVVEPPSPNLKLGRQTGIRHGGMGDLIELEDAFELGSNAGDNEGDVLPDPNAFAAFDDDEPARGRGSRRVGSTALQDAGAAGLTVRSAMAARKKGD